MDSDAQFTFRHGGGKSGEIQGILMRLTPGGLSASPEGTIESQGHHAEAP